MKYEYFCKESDNVVYMIINAETPSELQLSRKTTWEGVQGNIIISMDTNMGNDLLNMSIINRDGELIVIDAVKKSEIELKQNIQKLKQNRDNALNTNTVTINGHIFDSRPKDLSNIQLGIDKGETLWPDVNDFMVDVTIVDLTKLLTDGINQGEVIWDNYKLAVKAIQS